MAMRKNLSLAEMDARRRNFEFGDDFTDRALKGSVIQDALQRLSTLRTMSSQQRGAGSFGQQVSRSVDQTQADMTTPVLSLFNQTVGRPVLALQKLLAGAGQSAMAAPVRRRPAALTLSSRGARPMAKLPPVSVSPSGSAPRERAGFYSVGFSGEEPLAGNMYDKGDPYYVTPDEQAMTTEATDRRAYLNDLLNYQWQQRGLLGQPTDTATDLLSSLATTQGGDALKPGDLLDYLASTAATDQRAATSREVSSRTREMGALNAFQRLLGAGMSQGMTPEDMLTLFQNPEMSDAFEAFLSDIGMTPEGLSDEEVLQLIAGNVPGGLGASAF